MLSRIARALWGNFESAEELKKFGFLASIFGLIIGTYWTLRPMKDGIFDIMIGVQAYQPYAKILSLIVVFPLVIIYSKLIDKFSRQKVFYILISIYAVLAFVFAFFFLSSTYGLTNTIQSPARILGWAWYVYVESFGSLIVALFWAFTADTTSPESARRGFPFVALFGQFGNIFGPLLFDAKRLGWLFGKFELTAPISKVFVTPAPVVVIAGFLMVLTGILFWTALHVVPKEQWVGYKSKAAHEKEASEPGFLEGLTLLLSRGYLLGIFLIVTIYEVIITVLDFHFKATASAFFGEDKLSYTSYLNQYGYMTGVVATACVLLGISNIQRRLGMTASLLLLPVIVSIAVIGVKSSPGSVTLAFWIMVFSKAINYALNQPTLKQLYIPTTEESKYKSQAWIEMFGSRFSKGLSSYVNTWRRLYVGKMGLVAGVSSFLFMTTVFSLSLVAGWLFVAVYVSQKYNKAIADNDVVC